MNHSESPVIFTPDNEPYLGRKLLYHFDLMISSTLQLNGESAQRFHNIELNDHQKMACQIISQGLSIAFPIRELIRQGYLFGANVMFRNLFERMIILLYLEEFPEEINKWNDGWHGNNAPSLSKMLDKIQQKDGFDEVVPGKDLTAWMNGIEHAKPESALYNMTLMNNGKIGHAISKILNRPDLCDSICMNVLFCMAIMQAMIVTYFPTKDCGAS